MFADDFMIFSESRAQAEESPERLRNAQKKMNERMCVNMKEVSCKEKSYQRWMS